jgi:hypothetical protein
MLLDRSPGGMRPYDLLAEGRFDVAIRLMTGGASPAPSSKHEVNRALPAIPSVLAQVSIRHDDPNPKGRLDLRRSGRLKR